MLFNDNIIDFITKNINQIPTLFSIDCYDFDFCAFGTWNEPNTLNYIIKDYELFYNKSFTRNNKYPL
jgi:hypothetical protein